MGNVADFMRPTRINCWANRFRPGSSGAAAAGVAPSGISPLGNLANTLAIVCSGPGVDTVVSSPVSCPFLSCRTYRMSCTGGRGLLISRVLRVN